MLLENRMGSRGACSLLSLVIALGAVACGDDTTAGGGGSGGVPWTGGNGGTGAGGSPDGGAGAGGSPDGGAGAGGSPDGGGGDGGSGGGACTSPAQCDDDDACTEDLCVDGACVGMPIEVSDAVDCTVDACDPDAGLTHTPDDMACDDFVGCTLDGCAADVGCENVPSDALCNAGEGCDPLNGCQGSTITSVTPDDGLASGTTTVTLVGTGLTMGSVTFAGVAAACDFSGAPTTVVCTVPPASVGRGDVMYVGPGSIVATLPDGWTYTGVLNETDVPGEADYCNLQFPLGTTVTASLPSELVYGRIYEDGVTNPAGPDASVLAEVGWGPMNADPRENTAWRFAPATFNVQVGNDDEYSGTITVPTAGMFSFTYRFSFDDGVNFTYCDTNGAGSNAGLTFEAGSLGTLIAN